ncbi:TonB-dependent receptor [Joostella sp.]|uniref:TonB-dependent receptor n=1 Tax=Joostella sp. TaxID=2231138 RepID=UPI003A953670
MKKLILLFVFISQVCIAQQKKDIEGVVADKLGDPIVGATIIDKSEPTNGVVSGFDGQFTISIAESSKELEVSFLGFKTQIITIESNFLNVILNEDAEQLEGVTVQGFESVAGKARVRIQAIQSSPETTVALNSSSIETSGINNIQAFTSQISNVSFNQAQQPGVNFLTVRGISQIRNGESPVAVVIDGMTLPDASAMNMSLYDLELLEFVKGPQGTLYGKNAIAGAINITTKDPTNINKNKFTLSTGNGGLFGLGLSSSGAVVKNKLYYSITGRYKTFNGLINNTFLNEKVDFSKEYNVRAKLKYRIGIHWSATLVQDNFKVNAGGNYYITKTDILDPSIPVLADDDYSREPFGDIQGDSELSNSLSSFKIEGSLENVKIQSVTSYNATKRYYIGENDYSQYAFSKVSQQSNSNTFSQEIRLISKDKESTKLNYNFGGLFQNSKRYLNTYTFLNRTYYEGGFLDPSAANADYSTDPLIGNDDNNTIQTLAGFAFFDYKLTKKITLSAGVRIDYDKLQNKSKINDSTLNNNITVWQPKLSLSYQLTEKILAYANYGRGYRSGGFNSEATVKFDKTYDPEFTNSYEIGIKTSFLNNRIIFNNSLYLIDFENQQQYTFIPVTPSVLGIYNFEEARISGFESEIKFKATNYLDFFASFGFNSGEIKKGVYNKLTNSANFDYETHETIDVSGNASPYSVKSTIQFGANSYFSIGEKSDMSLHLNLDSRGKQYWDPLEEYVQNPYTLVNARVKFNYNKIGLAFWANNILDTKYNQEFFPTAEFGFNNIRFPNVPVTVGIDLSYKF